MNEEEQTSDLATGSNGDMTKKEETIPTNDHREDDDDVVTSARAGYTGHPPASPPPRPSGRSRSSSSRDGGADQSGFSCDAESAFRIVDGLVPPPLSESLARLLCLGAFARSTPTTTTTSTVRPPSPFFFSFTPFFVAVSCSSRCEWVLVYTT